jgi:hypothetical protein
MSEEFQYSKSLEERVSLLEIELKTLKECFLNLVASKQESLDFQIKQQTAVSENQKKPSPISVTLVNKTFHNANYNLGDAGDRIDFTFVFQSHIDKDVRAFKGVVIIKDLFEQDILRVTLTHETDLKAKGTAVWEGGIQYNQFMETHQRLLTVKQSDILVSFDCESIIYRDGARESFPR